jgi:hypothetical protein
MDAFYILLLFVIVAVGMLAIFAAVLFSASMAVGIIMDWVRVKEWREDGQK